ncbi:hypothetical protein J6590_082687 [Homalodisca vitripennis]|nr:hypothetical protein J6590_082687 [Homalodisca vitripennis]
MVMCCRLTWIIDTQYDVGQLPIKFILFCSRHYRRVCLLMCHIDVTQLILSSYDVGQLPIKFILFCSRHYRRVCLLMCHIDVTQIILSSVGILSYYGIIDTQYDVGQLPIKFILFCSRLIMFFSEQVLLIHETIAVDRRLGVAPVIPGQGEIQNVTRTKTNQDVVEWEESADDIPSIELGKLSIEEDLVMEWTEGKNCEAH